MEFNSDSINQLFGDISGLSKIEGFSYTASFVSSNGMPYFWTSGGWYNEDGFTNEDPSYLD